MRGADRRAAASRRARIAPTRSRRRTCARRPWRRRRCIMHAWCMHGACMCMCMCTACARHVRCMCTACAMHMQAVMRDEWTWSGIPGMRFELQGANAVLVTPWGHGTWGVVPSRTDVLFAEFAQQVHMLLFSNPNPNPSPNPNPNPNPNLTRCTCCSSRARRRTRRWWRGTSARVAPTASSCAASVEPRGDRFCRRVRRSVHRGRVIGKRSHARSTVY